MARRRFMKQNKKLADNTLLLLHFDNNLIDSVTGSMKIATMAGSLRYANSPAKFGNSIYGFTHAAYVNIANTDAINESLYENYTIDFWLYCTTSSSTGIFSKGDPSGSYSMDFILSEKSSDNFFRIQYAGTVEILIKGWSIPKNQWVHVATVKKGTTWSLYINGYIVGQDSSSYSSGFYSSLKLGYYRDYNQYFQGYIDEFRISKVARWTSNFTPPTKPY